MEQQWQNVGATCGALAELISAGHELLITHGNGPQVGNLLLMNGQSKELLPALSLDYWDANTQGGIGYQLQSSLTNKLHKRGESRCVVSLTTMVVVEGDDPAFKNPTKPVGPFFEKEVAQRMAAERDWTVREDANRGWRRVVPSPRPHDIVSLPAINTLLDNGIVTIAVGGGGIPVIRRENGTYRGVEAVIDKDLASSLAARVLNADVFAIATDVSNVALNYGTPDQLDINQASADEMRRYAAEGHFAVGSMGPKVAAALEFIDSGGCKVIITSPGNLSSALNDETIGTRITA
jgi:carbamate kinase